MVLALLFNGTLYLAYDGIFDWSRDASTWSGIAALVILLAIARRRPAIIRPIPFTVGALSAAMGGYALGFMGIALAHPAPVVASAVLVSVADAWAAVLWVLALSTLSRRRACLCLACSGALAVPIAYCCNAWAPYGAVNVVAMLASIAGMLVCLPLTKDFFARLATMGIPAEQELAQPKAFLPRTHPFHVYIFIFSLAYGFALCCEDTAGPMASSVSTLLVNLAVAVYAARMRGTPRADALFIASFTAVAVGFMLVLTGDARVGECASVLLMAGYMCFQLLTWYVLCSAASRSAADAIPTICWGTAISYAGICVGVLLWQIPNELLAQVLHGDGLLQAVLVAFVLVGLVLYTLLTRRAFVFDAAIEGIETPAPPPQVQIRYVDSIERCCDRVALDFALTARETDVMRLLARGFNASRIQVELGIGYNTVRYHVKNVYAKTAVHSQQELIDVVCGR